MKYNELIRQVIEVFKDTDYYECLNTTHAQLRIAGLLYDKYLYRREYKDIEKSYMPEQIIQAANMAFDFINSADRGKFNNEQHKINFVINCIQRNLKMIGNSANMLEDELKDVLEMEI